MKRSIRMKIFAGILIFVLICTNCYVPETYAANNKGKDKKETVQEQKKKKSNPKTDIIVKYKNESKKDNVISNVKSKAKAKKLEQKNYMKKQKISVYEIGETDDLNKVIMELNADPNVEYAQPNYPLTVAGIPTDEEFPFQWALYNDGQDVDGYTGRAGADIGAINAWDLTTGSGDTVIGILDTGIDIEHDDLIGNIFVNEDEIPDNNIDDDGNGYIDDINGWDFSNDDAGVYDSGTTDVHGTYVAGIIAAASDNGGVVGVAPDVKVLPLKFIHGTMGYTSDAIEAVEYAMNMGVGIVNCSFGGTDNNPALKDAMEHSGILFICSAGNRGADTAEKPVYPAAFDIDNVLSVAAVDSKGVMPSFTSYGADVDVAAPGISVLSTVPEDDDSETKDYDYYSGTSVSAAVVSGIAALVRSYLPSESIMGIKERILDGIVPCSNLEGKVASGGRVHAFGALTGTLQPADDYDGVGNYDDILPVPEEGEADTWYLMDEFASNVERFHYGEGGVNPASGNYSVTCTDMSIPAPGFSVELSRSYNSRNQRQTLLGRGWTFGFEGNVTDKGYIVEVSLPNGSAHAFHYKNGKYVGEGTRAAFVRNVSGTDILTTKDQYRYGFDSSHHKLIYMEDKNGNRINLTYNSGKLTKITDTAGREYTLTYNNKSLISAVTDPAGRSVTYEYNTGNLLTRVTDPQGGVLTYEYDSSQFLTKLIDQNGHTFQQLAYSHSPGDAQNKVVETTDAAGETWYYSYNMNQRNATISNNDNKKWTYYFDAAMFTVRVQDPEGRSSFTEYTFQDSNTYYGDIKAAIDRNGNRTYYDVDLATGNMMKAIYPDGGAKTFVYDQWNNVTEETIGEMEGDTFIAKRRTFFIYDPAGKLLLKKVQPLDGTRAYAAGNTTDFAVTGYEYYTRSSASTLFGCNVDGLLKSVTDPVGNTTAYTYNRYGDITSVTDAAGNTTTYTYDSIGQKLSETTPAGDTFRLNYDRNGMVIREIHPDGGVKRTVYDPAGYTLLEVKPMQYEAAKDNITTGVYTGTAGTKYEWYDNGYQKAMTDEAGNRTEYTWDIFGNKVTEKKPNGSIYRYEYDVLKRPTKTYFKENASATEVLLNESGYGVLMDCNSQTTVTPYADNTQKSTMATVKDFAGREVEVQYGSYSRVRTVYDTDGTVKLTIAANGAITYYHYDSLGNLTGVWKPMSVVEGTMMYSWTGYTYDRAGRVIEEKTGKSLVTYDPESLSNPMPADVYAKQYVYEDNHLVEETDSDGRRTSYIYDGDGRVIRKEEAVTAGETRVTEKTYNYLGLPTIIIRKARTGDIAGNDYADNTELDISGGCVYDLNGNLIQSIDAAGNVTTYTYDVMDRLLTTTRMLKDASGEPVEEAITSRTYTWDGQTASDTDSMGNTTAYAYDARGNQIKVIDALGNTSYKAYDRMGRATAVVSPENYIEGTALTGLERTEYRYDELGRMIRQTEIYQKMTRNSTGAWDQEWVTINAKTQEYDTLGNITKTTDALGNSTLTDYNMAGMPEYVTDAETAHRGLPYTVRYTYNGLGQKIKETYNGAVYTYTYDGAGNVLRTEVNNRIKSTVPYDLLGRAVAMTDGNGNTTLQKWNALGEVSETITPGDNTIPGNRTIYQYDVLGNLILSNDDMGTATTYTYDSFGRNLSITVSGESGEESITSRMTYDLNGIVLSHTDGNGNTSSMTYDALSRKVTQIDAIGQITTYAYDADGNILTETNHLGNSTRMMYDGINRLVEVKDTYGCIVQQLMYNDANAQDSSFDALGNETIFHYDRNLRQTGTTDGEGNHTYISYDSRGNVNSRTDGNGNTTAYAYDGENRLVSVIDALGNRTSYTYDANGNVLSQTDGNRNTTTYTYNTAGLLTARIDPDGNGNPDRTERYTYLANGLTATKTDRNGVVTTYSYDSFGRLLSEGAGGEVQSYTYDNNGNLLTTTDTSGITEWAYDALNRSISKTVPDIGISIYEYDLPGSGEGEYAERTKDPKGNVTLKTYDRAGRLSLVQVDEDEPTLYSYYPDGSRYRITYPDGTAQTYAYNRNKQITSLINAGENGVTLSSHQYTYDGAGNQLTKTESRGTTTYTYDSLNRLSTVKEPEGKETSYIYDGAGNRRAETVRMGEASATITYIYNSQNRLTATLSTSGEETRYSYDSNGNLLNKSSGISLLRSIAGGTGEGNVLPNFNLIIRKDSMSGTGTKDLTLYRYDHYNRLIETKSENNTSSYSYNAQGSRIEKTVNGVTTRYLYDYDKVVLETDENNHPTAFNVYGSGSLLYRSVTADSGTEAQNYYYRYNAHGDVTSLTDSEGNIAATYDYDAFGNILAETGSVNNNIKYAGYQHDEESGLYYLNARYYDSTTARFISEDTYRGQADDPLSLNLYTYCANNPIMFIDPTGHELWKLDTLVDESGGKMFQYKDNIIITANSITKVYKTNELFSFNNETIMDDRLFMVDFNYHTKAFDFKKKLKLDSDNNDIYDLNFIEYTNDDLREAPIFWTLNYYQQMYVADAVDAYGFLVYFLQCIM